MDSALDASSICRGSLGSALLTTHIYNIQNTCLFIIKLDINLYDMFLYYKRNELCVIKEVNIYLIDEINLFCLQYTGLDVNFFSSIILIIILIEKVTIIKLYRYNV